MLRCSEKPRRRGYGPLTILDTSVVIDRIRRRMRIDEMVTVVTLAEFPSILEYAKFQESIIYPTRDDMDLAVELQLKLRGRGRPKPFSDLLIAAIYINRNEELVTKDKNFHDIAEVSNLKIRFE